ncbi:hypothetical protein D3C77_378510 [compost metagenome]
MGGVLAHLLEGAGFAGCIDVDIAPGIEVDVVVSQQVGAALVDIALGVDVQVVASLDLAGGSELLLKAILGLEPLGADEHAHAVVVTGNPEASALFLGPVGFALLALRRNHVDVTPGIQTDIAPGTDAATFHVDVTLGLQHRITLGRHLAADAGAALRLTPRFLGRSHRDKAAGSRQASFLPVLLAPAVGRIVGRDQVDVAAGIDQPGTQLDIVAGLGFTGAYAHIAASGNDHVVAGFKHAGDLGGTGLQLALAALGQAEEA